MLQGKTALITGGTSGIGFATVRLFLKNGARVAITGRDRRRLDHARQQLGDDIVAIEVDVYRQPMPLARIQESLLLIFGLGTTLRLLIVAPSGQLSLLSLQLALEALPVVFLVTSYAARRAPPLPPKLFEGLVCALLIGTGFSMGIGAFLAMR